MTCFNDHIRDFYLSTIHDMTVPCMDNGRKFTRSNRLTVIRKQLKNSPYSILKDFPLAKIYQHSNLNATLPISVVSSHIDSVQKNYFSKESPPYIHGTFDNSATTAILTSLMVMDKLNPQTIVVFTGNEENGFNGAKQTSSFIKRASHIFLKLRFILSIDLTNDSYNKKHLTIENISFGNHRSGSLYDLTSSLHHILPNAGFPPLAAPDDSFMYAKQKLTSFSLCLPCKNIHQSMHDEQGVSIKINSISHYANALSLILNNTNNL